MSSFMCTGLHNSFIASDVRLKVPCPELGGASKPRGKMFGELNVATWNVGSIIRRNWELVEILKSRKVNIAYVMKQNEKEIKIKKFNLGCA